MRGGGIKLYYLDFIDLNECDELTWSNGPLESLVVTACVPGIGKLVVGGLYRPPSQPISEFYGRMDQILCFCTGKRVVLGGDIIIDFLRIDDTNTRNLKDLMSSYNFQNGIDVPTYVSPISNTAVSSLDHIWHNLSIDCKNFVVEPGVADHYAAATIFSSRLVHKELKITFRDYSRENIQKFSENLHSDFSSYDPPLNVYSYADYLVEFLHDKLNKYFPCRTKIFTLKRLKAPWLTVDIVRCIDKKRDWFRKMKLNLITRRSYNSYCRALRELLSVAEREYYTKS